MCIYCGTNKYRKIYQEHFGPIPKDSNGRSYEIHHIDGNHDNNDYNNLKCITIQEHYDLHYSQEDYGACYAISVRMKSPPEALSEIARKVAYKKLADGTHPFLDPAVQRKGVEAASIVNNKRIANGTHNFQSGKIQGETSRKRVKDGTHHWLGPETNLKKIKDGTHPFIGGAVVQKQLADGKHTSQLKKVCEYCNKLVGLMNFKKWHGDQCLLNPDNSEVIRTSSFTFNNPSLEKKTCEYCFKLVGKGNYARWHGDNCRFKN